MSNWQEELADRFNPDIDCVLFRSLEEAAEKAEFFLKNEDKREEIARNGHERTKEFTYEKQFGRILDVVFKE